MRFCFASLALALGLLTTSCVTNRPGVKTIAAVTPYSTLSDGEIEAQFQNRMSELDSLNEEMKDANSELDLVTVNSKAKQSLDKAYDARNLARHIDDPESREARLTRIGKLIGVLEHVDEITREGQNS